MNNIVKADDARDSMVNDEKINFNASGANEKLIETNEIDDSEFYGDKKAKKDETKLLVS